MISCFTFLGERLPGLERKDWVRSGYPRLPIENMVLMLLAMPHTLRRALQFWLKGFDRER